jgi:polyhydroxyalkanoate synthesis repressor PhaR
VMTNSEQPIVIKKYPTRRLYNTRASAHVTLDDVAAMVKNGDYFIVQDVKTGEDITRLILTQVIFEQEKKIGQNLLPITFLRQLIRFYGDGMQAMVRRYLEISIESLARDQTSFQRQISLGVSALGLFEERARRNIELFERTLLAPLAGLGVTSGGQETPLPKGSKIDQTDDLVQQRHDISDDCADKDTGR